MIRLIGIGVWICLVTVAAAYVAGTWSLGRAGRAEARHGASVDLEHKKTAPISVPIIVNGAVEGYVTAQFTYVVDAKALTHMSISPDAFVIDEAFRALYTEPFDFKHIEKFDLAALTKALVSRVNQRLGDDIVRDVLIGEFNYVPRDEISK
jgi:hypothetical protein